MPDVLAGIACFCAAAVQCNAVYRLFGVYFDRQSVGRKKELAFFFLSFVICVAKLLLDLPPLVKGVLTIGMFPALSFLYPAKVPERLARALGIVALMFPCEGLVAGLMSLLPVSAHTSWVTGSLLSQLVLLMLSLVLKRLHTPRTTAQISRLYWLAILCLPTGSLLIYLLVISDYYNPAGSGIFLPVSSILLLLNLLTFYVLDRLEEYSSACYERELLEQQNRAYRAQFDLMQQSEHQVRALRHDMKNHLTMLQAFAARGETDTLTQYLSTCSEQLVQPGYVHTGNPEIDGILNYKLEHAHQLGAKLELDISLPERLTASPFDLNVILGNLLDNAVEGLARSGEKRLFLSLRFDRGMLFLRLTNTYDGVALKTGELEGGVYRSRKDESGHGLGLSIVRRTVEKYHGQLRLEDTGTLFTAEAVLYLDS